MPQAHYRHSEKQVALCALQSLLVPLPCPHPVPWALHPASEGHSLGSDEKALIPTSTLLSSPESSLVLFGEGRPHS